MDLTFWFGWSNFAEKPSNGDGGDAIKVYLRIRPPGEGDLDHSGQILEVKASNAVVLKSEKDKMYTFDHVADIHTTQVRSWFILQTSVQFLNYMYVEY